MDLGTTTIGAGFVVVVVEALKDFFPRLTGNLTRLVAVIVGLILGYLGQRDILPLPGLTLVTGFAAAVSAVAVHTLVTNGDK